MKNPFSEGDLVLIEQEDTGLAVVLNPHPFPYSATVRCAFDGEERTFLRSKMKKSDREMTVEEMLLADRKFLQEIAYFRFTKI